MYTPIDPSNDHLEACRRLRKVEDWCYRHEFWLEEPTVSDLRETTCELIDAVSGVLSILTSNAGPRNADVGKLVNHICFMMSGYMASKGTPALKEFQPHLVGRQQGPISAGDVYSKSATELVWAVAEKVIEAFDPFRRDLPDTLATQEIIENWPALNNRLSAVARGFRAGYLRAAVEQECADLLTAVGMKHGHMKSMSVAGGKGRLR